MSTRYEIGAARQDITRWKHGLGMMGWGMLHNDARSVATPLSARAFVLRDPATGDKLALVCCELAFISLALREAVCATLRAEHPDRGLDLDNVMLMATHTHSGPGGFTHYAFYNVTIPGFAPEVLDGLANGIVRAICTADDARKPGEIRWDEGEFDPDVAVAFNRSITAYNRNPDVTPVVAGQEHLALDRKLRLMRFDDDAGQPLGSINWFAVHCTSVHSDNHALHFDNKGYAAAQLEADLGRAGGKPVVAFAQGASGDVTPNFRRHPGKPFVRGAFADDDASARHNGAMQATLAAAVHAAAATREPMPTRIRFAHAFVDMGAVEVDPRFVDGRTGLRTAPGEIGMAMFFGTEEGPGLPRAAVGLQRWIARAAARLGRRDPDRDAAQAEKVGWVDSTRNTVLGLGGFDWLPRVPLLPRREREALRMFRALARDAAAGTPWTPQVLPIQLAIIGELALVAVPHEFTTVAGRRLCASVGAAVQHLGVGRTILVGYANAYAGYVTTPQEYELQDYEGASTHFGKWTLPAYQTVFAQLAASLCGEAPPRPSARPPTFAAEDLARRSFAL